MNKLVNKLGLGHTIAIFIVAIMLAITASAKADMVKRINYAIDYELGIAQQCDGTDSSYEVYGCKYDYSDLMNQ
nr:MAG TPA: hypothetical protein [Caudoviricetes sp.]